MQASKNLVAIKIWNQCHYRMIKKECEKKEESLVMDAKRESEDISFYSKTQIRLSRIRYYPSFVLAICSCSIVSFISL